MSTQPSTVTAPAPDLPPVLKANVSPNGSPNSSGHPETSHPQAGAHPRPSRTRTLLIGGLVLAVAGAGLAAYLLSMGPKAQRTDLILHTVKYEPVRLTVVERGALGSADNREVTCRVRAGTKATDLRMKWVIDDGAQVKAGERLMEIEDSALQDQLKAEKIVLDTARGAMVAAEENYK